HIVVERTAGHAVITLNRPEKLNALSSAMKAELIALLDELQRDEQLRVLLLTGAGDKSFCAGTDIRELSELSPAQGEEVSASGQEIAIRIERFPVPVIACVNGIAAGGGFEIILPCHLRIAATTSTFSLPETWLGLMPAYGATQRLAREIGISRAVELMLT